MAGIWCIYGIQLFFQLLGYINRKAEKIKAYEAIITEKGISCIIFAICMRQLAKITQEIAGFKHCSLWVPGEEWVLSVTGWFSGILSHPHQPQLRWRRSSSLQITLSAHQLFHQNFFHIIPAFICFSLFSTFNHFCISCIFFAVRFYGLIRVWANLHLGKSCTDLHIVLYLM